MVKDRVQFKFLGGLYLLYDSSCLLFLTMAFQYRTTVRYFEIGELAPIVLPGIITESGVLISHLRYLAYFSQKSLSWKRKSVTAIILLLRYFCAFENKYSSPRALLKSFVRVLSEGTIDYQTLQDRSGLYWKPRSPANIRDIVGHINQFTDYLSRISGCSENVVNPFRKATSSEVRLNWCAHYNKKKNLFMAHLASKEKASIQALRMREIMSPYVPIIKRTRGTTKRFPEDTLEKLLREGFRTRHYEPDYKSIAMTLLMHCGGLRASELFHIYISDITPDPNVDGGALVRCYHPIYGQSPDKNFSNRKDYLSSVYGLCPRNLTMDSLYSGWKAPLLTDDRLFFDVYFSSESSSKLFFDVWIKYLETQRIDPPESRDHPYLFTNSSGQPETMGNFRSIHRRAIERIGLSVRKNLGTTLHAHRHAYGHRLAEYGMSQVEIQRCMHHKNPNSCLIYLEPTDEEIRKKFEGAGS